MFRTIQLFWMPNHRRAEACAEEAERYLVSRGVTVLRPEDMDSDRFPAAQPQDADPVQVPAAQPQDADPDRIPQLMITFGGDGTLLGGARRALQMDIPLMGINLGTIGFLTEEEPSRLQEALERILQGAYMMEERFLLEAVVVPAEEHLPQAEPHPGEELPRTSELSSAGTRLFALNDVVVSRGGFARLIRTECTVNGEPYGVFTADGLVVSTPTGSTGYNLSAGGPIVEPGMDCMIITPICPHSLQHCSSVISSRSEIRISLCPDRSQSAVLQIDGQSVADLRAGDEIVIRGTDRKMRLLRLHPYSFFTRIRKKIF